jgi:transglutaminase-like putative cysteine protease
LAALFIDVCRALGIAARFVSGYEESDALRDGGELHAWAEVYIPGAGWRGYDPSRGLAVAQSHVAVAAAATAAGTAPVTGTFRGSGVTSEFETEVRVERRVAAMV